MFPLTLAWSTTLQMHDPIITDVLKEKVGTTSPFLANSRWEPLTNKSHPKLKNIYYYFFKVQLAKLG
jgi:hypothetical protein